MPRRHCRAPCATSSPAPISGWCLCFLLQRRILRRLQLDRLHPCTSRTCAVPVRRTLERCEARLLARVKAAELEAWRSASLSACRCVCTQQLERVVNCAGIAAEAAWSIRTILIIPYCKAVTCSVPRAARAPPRWTVSVRLKLVAWSVGPRRPAARRARDCLLVACWFCMLVFQHSIACWFSTMNVLGFGAILGLTLGSSAFAAQCRLRRRPCDASPDLDSS